MNVRLGLLSGDEQEFVLEHRLLNMLLVAVAISFLVGSVANYLMGLNAYINAIHIGGSLLLLYMYYLARFKKNYNLPVAILIISGVLFIFPAVWFTDGGSYGGMPLFMMLGTSFFAIILNRIRRIAVVGIIMCMAVFLMGIEYCYPASIIGYSDAFTRYVDLAVSLCLAMIINVYIIYYLVHLYKKEQAKVQGYIAELENHKAKLERQAYTEEMNVKLKQEMEERIKFQESRQVSDEKFSSAFEASPVPMCMIATNPLRFIEVNTSAAQTFGYDKSDFCKDGASLCLKIMPKEQYSIIVKELRERGTINKLKTAFYDKGKMPLNGLLSVGRVIIGGECLWLCVWDDITQLKHMETELKRLEQLNAVSKMAVNLAHEIRNPMTTVRGFLQLMEKKNIRDSEAIKMMISEIDSANSIITQFLFMAKERMTNFQLKDINKIISNVLPLVEKDISDAGHYITLQKGKIPLVLVDENQIRQMLLNLIRNGIEAMNNKGKLQIKTYAEGSSVVLAISDQGPGIAPEIIEQIGTPFFTTKDDACGLGLAVCYSIAERHGAKIKIDTGEKGTTFNIKFKTAG